VEQDLRGLFQQALEDEPVPPPGDPARVAMVHGRRIRRRRGLLAAGAAAAVVAVAAVALNTALAPAAPRPALPAGEAMKAPACTAPDQASEVAVFLAPDITTAQRDGLRSLLQADPVVRGLRFETRDEAFVRFQQLWADSPDFASSVRADSLPESFRMTLAEPSAYPAFAARFRGRAGVQDVAGSACPESGR